MAFIHAAGTLNQSK